MDHARQVSENMLNRERLLKTFKKESRKLCDAIIEDGEGEAYLLIHTLQRVLTDLLVADSDLETSRMYSRDAGINA